MKILPISINTFKYQNQKQNFSQNFSSIPVSFRGGVLEEDVFQKTGSNDITLISDDELQKLKDEYKGIFYSVDTSLFTKYNAPFVKWIVSNFPAYSEYSIGNQRNEMLPVINEENYSLAAELIPSKRIEPFDIMSILRHTNSGNIEFAREMLAECRENNEGFDLKRFDATDISFLLISANKTNLPFTRKICSYKDERFPVTTFLGQTISAINDVNIDFAIRMLDDERFNWLNMKSILRAAQNKDDLKLMERLLEKKELPLDVLPAIVKATNETNASLSEYMCDTKTFPKEHIANILQAVDEENAAFAKKCIEDKDFPFTDLPFILGVFKKDDKYDKYFSDREDDFIEACKIISSQKRKCSANPDLYINDSGEEAIKELNSLFEKKFVKLALLADILGKEALDDVFRQRTEKLKERLKSLKKYSTDDIQSIKNLSSCADKEGNPITAAKKIEVMDLILAYNMNKVPFSKIEPNSALDIDSLKENLIVKVLENFGITGEEIQTIPKERLSGWNTDYTYLFSQELKDEDKKVFADFLRAVNLKEFYYYIYDTENKHGRANAKTIEQFHEMGLNHWNWTNPRDYRKEFRVVDENAEMLSQISELIEGDINSLRATPAKGFIDKLLSAYIEDDKFSVPKELTKAQLMRLVENIIKQLEPVWNRAQTNADSENESVKQRANNTLTILDHLKQRAEDISEVKDTKTVKSLDLTIKMWDRAPQKDIFQGNYSDCCIAMGGQNSSAMPTYITSSLYGMIELVDNKTSNVIGNALCYFVKKDNDPAFIIDNIEIKNSFKPSDENSIKLREAITDFAASSIKDVTGRDYTPIYLGLNYNDVYCRDLGKSREKVEISLIGTPDTKDVYMDAFGGWTTKYKQAKKELYRLR